MHTIDKSIVDSSIGGTKNLMILENVTLYGEESKITGTPNIKNASLGYSQVSDDVVLDTVLGINARIRNKAEAYNSNITAFNTVDHPVVIENARVYDSTVSQSARMSGSSILSGNSLIEGLTSLSGTVQVTGGCRLSSGSYSSGIISPGGDSPCEPAKSLNFKREKLNPRTKILKTQMTLIKKEKGKLLKIKNLKSRRGYAKLLSARESIIMRMGK